MIGINHDVAPSSSRRAVALFIQVTSDDWTLHPLRLVVAVRLPAKGKRFSCHLSFRKELHNAFITVIITAL